MKQVRATGNFFIRVIVAILMPKYLLVNYSNLEATKEAHYNAPFTNFHPTNKNITVSNFQ